MKRPPSLAPAASAKLASRPGEQLNCLCHKLGDHLIFSVKVLKKKKPSLASIMSPHPAHTLQAPSVETCLISIIMSLWNKKKKKKPSKLHKL